MLFRNIESDAKVPKNCKLWYKLRQSNNMIIVTSENNYTKNSFENYFTNVFSYEDLDSFVYKFNNFFKWIS